MIAKAIVLTGVVLTNYGARNNDIVEYNVDTAGSDKVFWIFPNTDCTTLVVESKDWIILNRAQRDTHCSVLLSKNIKE